MREELLPIVMELEGKFELNYNYIILLFYKIHGCIHNILVRNFKDKEYNQAQQNCHKTQCIMKWSTNSSINKNKQRN